MLMAGAHKYRRYYILVGFVLAAMGYTWQVAGEWDEQVNETAREQMASSASVIGSYGAYGLPTTVAVQRAMRSVDLNGIGIAAGATATLFFNNRYAVGQLHVLDLPVLPETKIYRLWCIDAAGGADASSVFRVPVDAGGEVVITIATPRLLYAYSHFRITIQPVGSSQVSPGAVVMAD